MTIVEFLEARLAEVGPYSLHYSALARLACVYSDHPDFNEEWRP